MAAVKAPVPYRRTMETTRYASAGALLEAAGDFLAAREAEHNLPLGILGTLRDHPGAYPEPPYLAAVTDGGEVALVAIRTPPNDLILSEPGVPGDRIAEAAATLVEDVLAVQPDLPGVLGPKPTVQPFVARWEAVTGRPGSLALSERSYRLSRAIPPRPTPGSWRRAEERDRHQISDWLIAFDREALPDDAPPRNVDGMIDRWLHEAGRAAFVWEVDGRSVSFTGSGSPTPNGMRIGPVYTPPGDRRQGYAGALVAAVSQHLLDQGSRFCFLFTDLANDTANHVYQAIGYEPVGDIDRYRLDPPAQEARP